MRFDLGQVVGPQGPAGKESVTEVTINGTTGIMKYEKGVGECWGYATVPVGQDYVDIDFPIAFEDNNFLPLLTKYQLGRKGDLVIQYVTANNMRVFLDNTDKSQEQHFYYYCKGKI